MGSHFSAPVKLRSERATRGILALFLVIGVLAAITITGSGIAGATDLSFGGYSPYIANGGVDVNFDGAITSADDSTGFMGKTNLKDGYLDCSGWDADNDFEDATPGDGAITEADDCLIKGYFLDSVPVYIWVENGHFLYTSDSDSAPDAPIVDGWKMPWLYNLTDVDPESDDYQTADWAWVVDAGYVDRDHDGNTGETTEDDAQNFWANGGDIENGLVDVNDDGSGTSSDDCAKCFFGLEVANGKVQSGTVSNPFLGGAGAPGATGPAGANGVSGRVAIAASSSTNSLNKSKSATCSGTTKVLGGGYSLTGDTATLAHLTVVANGPAGGTAWRVRVIEATPTSGTWSVTVTAICATA